MISVKEIEKLAALARIKMEDAEKEQFGKDIDAILGYVDTIKTAEVSLDQSATVGAVKNVLRDDAQANESGAHTEALLNEAPQREDDYIQVKKIL